MTLLNLQSIDVQADAIKHNPDITMASMPWCKSAYKVARHCNEVMPRPIVEGTSARPLGVSKTGSPLERNLIFRLTLRTVVALLYLEVAVLPWHILTITVMCTLN